MILLSYNLTTKCKKIMPKLDLWFKEQDGGTRESQSLENIKEKLKDKCWVLDKLMLQQFQQDYRNPLDDNLAKFEIWSWPLIKNLGANLIMAYNGDRDTMIVPESEEYWEYNICAHEMTHTLWDSVWERKWLLLLPDYDGPSIEQIENYATSRVEGRDFDLVRAQQEAHIIYASLWHLVNTFSSKINNLNNEKHSINSKLQAAKNDLVWFWQSKVTDTQQSAMDESFLRRDNLLKLSNHTQKEVAHHWESVVVPFIKDFDSILKNYKKDKGIFLTDRFRNLSSKLDSAIKRLDELLKELLARHMRYIDEAQKGYNQIEEIVSDNHKKWLKTMESQLNDPSIDQKTKNWIKENISMDKKFREISELWKLMSSITDSKDSLSNAVNLLTQQFMLENAKSKAREIIGNPEEVLGRMIDSLYSIYLWPIDQNNFPLNENDLDFLSQMRYKWEKIFRKGVEKYRVALKMQKSWVSIDKIRKELLSAETYEYNGKVYEWSKYPFKIQWNVPYVSSVQDIK